VGNFNKNFNYWAFKFFENFTQMFIIFIENLVSHLYRRRTTDDSVVTVTSLRGVVPEQVPARPHWRPGTAAAAINQPRRSSIELL